MAGALSQEARVGDATGREEPRDGATILCVVALSAAYVSTGILAILSGTSLAFGHPEKLEAALYVTIIVTPIGVVAAKRNLAGLRLEVGSRLALLNASAVACLLVTARIAHELSGQVTLALGLLLIGSILIAVANLEVFRRHRVVELLPGQDLGWRLPAVTGVLLVGATSAFFPGTYFRPAGALLVVGLTLAVHAAWRWWPTIRPSTRRRVAVDVLVLATMSLVVADLGSYGDAHRFDYDFFLGPVNAMLHGHPMLIETFSQYGVGLFYALAGVFAFVPVTYGGLQAILCLGYIVEFALVYGVLRASCRSQIIATTGLALAVVANLAIPSSLPHIAYPSTGPLRFGIPWIVVLVGVVSARSSRMRPRWQALMLATVGAASVWNLETFWFCASAYFGIVVTRFMLEPDSLDRRLRRLMIDVLLAFAVGIAAVASASILTRALAGGWPDWRVYMDLLATYGLEGFGTLPVPTWSTGYLVAAVYVLSAIGVMIMASKPAAAQRLAPQLTAIGGATAYGATSFTYFLGRSAPSNLHHVAIPAVVVACTWVSILRPWLRAEHRWLALSVVAVAAWLGASLVAHSADDALTMLGKSPLVQGVRAPTRPIDQARGLFRPDRRRPEVAEATRLLRSHVAAGTRPVVLVRPDLLTTALLAGGYGNALPIVNGNQDRLIVEDSLKTVAGAVDNLPSGTVVLTERPFLARPPSSFKDVLADSTRFRRHGDFYIARILAEVGRRFAMRIAERGKYGLVVVELGRRL